MIGAGLGSQEKGQIGKMVSEFTLVPALAYLGRMVKKFELFPGANHGVVGDAAPAGWKPVFPDSERCGCRICFVGPGFG